jgi:hypothetical protein
MLLSVEVINVPCFFFFFLAVAEEHVITAPTSRCSPPRFLCLRPTLLTFFPCSVVGGVAIWEMRSSKVRDGKYMHPVGSKPASLSDLPQTFQMRVS